MNEPLCIITWNSNDVQLHTHKIEQLLKNNELDVLLLSEMHLTEGSGMYFKNYHCYQAHHPLGRARGVAAVIIKRNLSHHSLKPKIDPVIQDAFVDAAGEKLTLGAVYLPPNEPVCGTAYQNLSSSLKDPEYQPTGILRILVRDREQLHREGKFYITPSKSTVVQKIREKRTVCKIWQETRYPSHKTQLNIN